MCKDRHEPERSPIAEEFHRLRAELQERDEQLATRPVIDEAKGMLMQDFGLDPDEAFEALAAISREADTEVAEVAERVVQVLTGNVSSETAQRSYESIDDLREWLTGR